MRGMRFRTVCVFAVTLMWVSIARAVTYAEPGSGELSGDPNSPTPLGVFGPGTHSVTATSSFGEQDDFTFSIPAGFSLSSLVPATYVGDDGTAFIGLASGNTIPNQGLAPGNLLGYTHFGDSSGNVGQNMLPDMATGFGAIGFTPPLGPGTYSIWTQQLGDPTTYRLDFTVVPEPGGIGLLALAGVGLARGRRRRRRG